MNIVQQVFQLLSLLSVFREIKSTLLCFRDWHNSNIWYHDITYKILRGILHPAKDLDSKSTMGCANHSKTIIEPRPSDRSPKGILQVHVSEAHLDRNTSYLYKMDPYVTLRLNNQNFSTRIAAQAGGHPKFDSNFTFIINDDKLADKRTLEIGVWDKNKFVDSRVGFGVLNCQPFIKGGEQLNNQKVYVSHNGNVIGYVLLSISFKQQFVGVLYLQVRTASIRRKTSTLTDMRCVARVTVGQEVFTTAIQKDTRDQPPLWSEVFRINVILSTMVGKLEILDIGVNKATLVGTLQLDIRNFLDAAAEKTLTQQIHFDHVNAGTVTYSVRFLPKQIPVVQKQTSVIISKNSEAKLDTIEERRVSEEGAIRQLKESHVSDIKTYLEQKEAKPEETKPEKSIAWTEPERLIPPEDPEMMGLSLSPRKIKNTQEYKLVGVDTDPGENGGRCAKTETATLVDKV